MRKPNPALTLLAAALFLSIPAASQASHRVPVTQIPATQTPASQTNIRAAKTPYTAEYKATHVQTLADGTTITHETTEVKALDSQGRRMSAFTSTATGHEPVTHFSVFDSVAHTHTDWNVPGKVAHVFQMSAPGESHCATLPHDDIPASTRPRAQVSWEELGTQTIQDIETQGRRHTTTIPAGTEGNDAPLVSTSERWTALTPGLNGLVVREITTDPRSGKSTRELTSLTQSDPDPSTFQPPEGYEIVTKEAPTCQGVVSTAGSTEMSTPK